MRSEEHFLNLNFLDSLTQSQVFYGDGSTEKVELPENPIELPDGYMAFSHEYPKPGKYKVMFTLSNLVTSLTLKTESYLLRRINGLSAEVGLKGRATADGYGNNKERFPTNKVIQFKLSTEEGDVEKYFVELNGQPFKATTVPLVSYSSGEVR